MGFNESFIRIVTAVSFTTILYQSYIIMVNESDGYVQRN